MVGGRAIREVLVFVTLYLLLSLIPFLVLNLDIIDAISTQFGGNVVLTAVLGTAILSILSGLVVAQEGVERYVRFLSAPTDVLSILVGVAFLVAATSWWLISELNLVYDWGLSLEYLLVLILLCHVPMVMLLSLLTAVGKAQTDQ